MNGLIKEELSSLRIVHVQVFDMMYLKNILISLHQMEEQIFTNLIDVVKIWRNFFNFQKTILQFRFYEPTCQFGASAVKRFAVIYKF